MSAAADTLDTEAGRLLFARPVAFVKGATSIDALPPADRPEVAFAGRSNVGKSSLINALVNRKALARASNAPGRTRELNYFDLDGRAYLVDLPGYGFARAPKEAVAKWTRLTRDYLRGRASLRRAYLLIDARHGVKRLDEEVMGALDETATSYQLVLTKMDKIAPSARAARVEETAERARRRPAAFPRIAATSAADSFGIAELRAEISHALQ
ncbi:MAG: ribosome biogenesis GTP-binding protein YihA/YsxC [Caulobacterales bacterium]|nr:ribosome biogenesis GTP-binding protein YihA/YsxC [Caulobacterales bacterium]